MCFFYKMAAISLDFKRRISDPIWNLDHLQIKLSLTIWKSRLVRISDLRCKWRHTTRREGFQILLHYVQRCRVKKFFSVTGGRGVNNEANLHDVIYRWSLNSVCQIRVELLILCSPSMWYFVIFLNAKCAKIPNFRELLTIMHHHAKLHTIIWIIGFRICTCK